MGNSQIVTLHSFQIIEKKRCSSPQKSTPHSASQKIISQIYTHSFPIVFIRLSMLYLIFG